MNNLNKYFDLFDQSRTSEQAFNNLINLFSEDITFILNGKKKEGIHNWKAFVTKIYEENVDLKHMYEGWLSVEGTDTYQTNWAICGKHKSGKVYTQTGKDIAKLNDQGEICYLENVPDNTDLFKGY
ncbi:nuclear transport factor 2 family protein [Alkalicoccobacillus gibsonii]|uniref:Nuclear transport factor 2 family protein n=1 Tax=Alkalicoccobacillus gibsonii TaxID=79881 RepID=A0ABU9VF93_9BACI